MKKWLLLVAAALLLSPAVHAQTVVPPLTKTKTSFAIVIDRESYDNTRPQVEAYRDAVERDGLGTYIVYHDWQSPEQVRQVLVRLHADRKSPLEGAVLVGEIPIPMVRDAQHMASAFKAEQLNRWANGSVPSDRFYDDFGLKFDFIKQDEQRPLYFYYSLSPDSKQHLSPDIYTARIRPLAVGNGDRYEQIAGYLEKVVRERTENPVNPADHLTMARGYGYNSESKVAWAGEQVALREQFPLAFMPGGRAHFIDFGQRYPAKNPYLNEIQRPELDIMLFHHHGSATEQLINGERPVSDPQNAIALVKRYIRSKVSSLVEDGTPPEEAIARYVEYLDVPRSWCEKALDEEVRAGDAAFDQMKSITTADILALSPQARFVMLDACFNGSFHQDEYMAGAYIFNDGRTIAVSANSVNVIQDKWPDQMLGLMACGVRIGQWNRLTCYLESHITGDPTYRFANTALNFDLNPALTLRAADNSYWRKLTSNTNPDIQALAYNMLHRNGYPGLSTMLREAYFNSPYFVVRMEAMELLSKIGGAEFEEVLAAAVDDSYELIRRMAVSYICKNGSNGLIPALVHSMIRDNTSERIAMRIDMFLHLMDYDALLAEIDRQLASTPLHDQTPVLRFRDKAVSSRQGYLRDMGFIMDRTSDDKLKKRELRSYRNMPAAVAVDNLLEFVADQSRTLDLRVLAAEALGWYNYSHRRQEVIDGLQAIAADGSVPDQVRNEARKSVNRLSAR